MICLWQQCDHNIWLPKRKRAIDDDKMMMMMMTLSASVDAKHWMATHSTSVHTKHSSNFTTQTWKHGQQLAHCRWMRRNTKLFILRIYCIHIIYSTVFLSKSKCARYYVLLIAKKTSKTIDPHMKYEIIDFLHPIWNGSFDESAHVCFRQLFWFPAFSEQKFMQMITHSIPFIFDVSNRGVASEIIFTTFHSIIRSTQFQFRSLRTCVRACTRTYLCTICQIEEWYKFNLNRLLLSSFVLLIYFAVEPFCFLRLSDFFSL